MPIDSVLEDDELVKEIKCNHDGSKDDGSEARMLALTAEERRWSGSNEGSEEGSDEGSDQSDDGTHEGTKKAQKKVTLKVEGSNEGFETWCRGSEVYKINFDL